MALSEAERAARVREDRKSRGLKRAEFWVTPEEKQVLQMQLELLRSQTSQQPPK